MAGKVPVSESELKKALEMLCVADGLTKSEGEDQGKKRYLLSPGDIIVRLEEGRIICDSQTIHEKVAEIIMDLRQSEKPQEPTKTPRQEERPPKNTPGPQRKPESKALVPSKPLDGLTPQDIIDYINPKATPAEAYLFAEFCRRKGADPLAKQVFLVIYEGQNGRQANFIAGKEYFTEKAEVHPQLAGFQAGIIVRKKEGGQLERRVGTFWLHDEEQLLGGWAEVERKDRAGMFRMEVPLSDYDTKKNLWVKMPATMIRKVALVQVLREAFPGTFGGLYDRAEMDQAFDPAKEVQA